MAWFICSNSGITTSPSRLLKLCKN